MQTKEKNKLILIAILAFFTIASLLLMTKIIKLPESIATDNAEPMVEVALNKFLNYDISEKDKGSLIQYTIRTEIKYKESDYVAINHGELDIDISAIDNKFPTDVKVITKSTQATNGNNLEHPASYTYDSTTGKLVINAYNINNNGEPIYTSGNKDEKDEYIILCYYNTYTKESPQRQAKLNIFAKYTMAEENNPEISTFGEYQKEIKEEFGTLTSIEKETSDIYNGYIKSNIINGTEYATEYKEISKITVSKKEAQEKITLTENNTFIEENENNEGEKIEQDLGNNNNLVYKEIKVNKRNIVQVLGEEGKLQVYDVAGEQLLEINKDTQYGEDGTFTFTYTTQPTGLIIKTSKVQKEGIIEIEHTKEIKPTMTNTNNTKIKTTDEIIGTKEIKTIENEQEKITEEVTFKQKGEHIEEIKDAQTKLDVTASKAEWTNEKQNEITLTLKLNSNGAQYNLFHNPQISIELPAEVEKAITKDCSMLYGNGLKLKGATVDKNENEKYVLNVEIEGIQTQYEENGLGIPTTIDIPLTVILKKDIKNEKTNLNITYTNDYGQTEIGNINKEIILHNFKKENEVAITETTNATLENIFTQNVTAHVLEENVQGKLKLEVVPTVGEKTLGDNDTLYEGEFIKYNIKVTNISNETINNAKIVAQIPEGVTYGELEADYYVAKGKYEYSFDETMRSKEITIDSLEAGKSYVGFIEAKANDLANTEAQKQINTNIKAYIGETEASSYVQTNILKDAKAKVFVKGAVNTIKDSWYYEVIVRGEGEVDLRLHVPEQFEFNYIIEASSSGKEWTADKYSIDNNTILTTVNPGTYIICGNIYSKTFKEYDVPNYEVDLFSYATATLNGIQYTSNENRIKVKYEHISILMESDKEGEEVNYKDEVEYVITLNNDGGTNLPKKYFDTTVNVKDYLPKEIIPEEVTYEAWDEEKADIEYDENGNEVSFIRTGNFTKSTRTEQIYGYDDGTGNNVNLVDITFNIPYGKTSKIFVKGTADLVYKKTAVENSSVASGVVTREGTQDPNIKTEKSNTITIYIKPPMDYTNQEIIHYLDNPDNQDDSDNPDNLDNIENNDNNNSKNNQEGNNQTYSVSGVVWHDENRNGQKDDNEKLLSGIPVMIIDTKNSTEIKARTTTNENGGYSFSNLQNSTYIVIFEYDTSNYYATIYKKSEVLETINSDAQDENITINGENKNVALTDMLTVNGNILNIDLGLVEKQTNNLKIDKYISNVSIKTAKRTSEISYNNAKLAKAEIRAKEIEGAEVTAEYKIVVTNTGSTNSKIGNIIEELPNGFYLDVKENKNWTLKNNTIALNSSIANRELNAGENVELTIKLNKKMTAEDTGIFTNTVIIDENNSSKADLIISISTGSIIFYTIIIICVLTCLGVGIYLVKRYGIINITKISMVVLITAIIMTSTSIAYTTSAPDSDGFRENSDLETFEGRSTGSARCNEPGKPGTPEYNGEGNVEGRDVVNYYTRYLDGYISYYYSSYSYQDEDTSAYINPSFTLAGNDDRTADFSISR